MVALVPRYRQTLKSAKSGGPVNIAGPPTSESGGAMAPPAPPVPTPMVVYATLRATSAALSNKVARNSGDPKK